MKKQLLLLLLFMCCLTTVFAKKKFSVMSGDESLRALTQITDKNYPCVDPSGGDNGRNLYFASCDEKGYYNIFKKENPISTSVTQITSGKNRNFAPCYSQVIGKVAFCCQNEGSSTSDIYTMPVQGKTMSPITETSTAYENHPSISPDGEWIVYDKCTYMKAYVGTWWFYFSNTIIVEKSEIWLRNIKTGESILIGNGFQPKFSPDGEKIVFVKYASDAKSTGIWLINIDGSNPIQLTDAKKGFAFSPAWSPDGSRLIFQSYKKDKKDFDLYVINVDGTGLLQLTKNNSSDQDPYWSSDNMIYFSSDRGNETGNFQIWRFSFEE